MDGRHFTRQFASEGGKFKWVTKIYVITFFVFLIESVLNDEINNKIIQNITRCKALGLMSNNATFNEYTWRMNKEIDVNVCACILYRLPGNL